MFERFTDGSRRAVVLAQEESRELGHRQIGPEHLFLGVAAVPDSTAATALADAGVTLPALRRAVLVVRPRGQTAPAGHIPFTPAAKKAMQLSLGEALRRRASAIDTGHVLLALLDSPDYGLRQVLDEARVDAETVSAATDRRLAELPVQEPPEPAPEPSATDRIEALLADVVARLERIERRLDGGETDGGTAAIR